MFRHRKNEYIFFNMWVIKYVVRVSIRLVKLFIPETILFREYHMKCWMRHALEYQYDEIVNIFSAWIKIFYNISCTLRLYPHKF